ncbi:MAG TPA: delta-60 repeat domain-containing protein [Blastocatellia bacterium]|nr:delta-60 repeat domain-containing protein [Blastocatellia bacterium]
MADFAGKETQGSALAIQPDGKLIEVGSVANATTDIAMARFNTDGTLDFSFGSGGIVMTDINGTDNSAAAVALQPDGRIVVAGSARDGSNNQSLDFALTRYNADGSLDPSFGVSGKVRTDLTGRADVATSLAIMSGGRLLVGGQTFDATNGGSNDAVLVAYTQGGSLDTTFGTGGKVINDVAGFAERINCLAIQADGKIAAGGFANLSAGESSQTFALLRYNPNGTPDQSFGTGGKVTTMFSGQEEARAIAILTNGKIVLAGSTFANQGDFAVARYNSDGSLDTAFGVGGKVTTDFTGNIDVGRAISLQADNKIIAGGWTARSNDSNTRDFALARYSADGSLDNSFGTAGKLTTDFEGLGDLGSAMLVQTDGKLVFAGSATHSTGPSTSTFRMVMARYTIGGAGAPGFSLAFDESPLTGDRGTKISFHVLINRTGGFTGNVTITPPDGSVIGVKVKPGDAVTATDDSIKFKLKIKAGAIPGHYALTFAGHDDSGHTATATIGVVIQ